MAGDTRLRTVNIDRDPLDEWSQKPSTRGQLEELRAKVNQLEYGGITADKLGGGTISQQSIQLAENASLYSGSPAADGFVLDKNGLRFYDGGVNTIDLRADGGTAKFTGDISASTITGGTLRTAISGERIQIDAGAVDSIKFFTGAAGETRYGRAYVFDDANWLYLANESPRTANDYAVTWVSAGKAPTDPAQWGASTYASAGGSPKSVALLDSLTGMFYQVPSFTVNIGTTGAKFQFVQPTATNATQLRFESIPAGGTTQVALGVDNAVVANELIVHAFNGTTPLGISASGFHVISKAAGKQNVQALPSVLDRVKKLKPVKYVRAGHELEPTKEKPTPGKAPDRTFVGFLAEEMVTQFPDAVVRDKEGAPQSIDLMAVVAILTQAIQEMS